MICGGHWVGRSVFWPFVHRCPGERCAVAEWMIGRYRRLRYADDEEEGR